MNKIEKCARLMGYKTWDVTTESTVWVGETGKGDLKPFNPLTNAQDLVDLMCVANISVSLLQKFIHAIADLQGQELKIHQSFSQYADHPTKQSATAHAVVDVAVQIYDSKFEGQE